MDRTIQLEITVRDGGGYIVRDPLGHRHYAHDERELAVIVRTLAHDPSMPEPQAVDPTSAILEDLGTTFATDYLPGPLRAAAPLIGRAAAEIGSVAAELGQGAADWIRRRPESPAPAPEPTPPPKASRPHKAERRSAGNGAADPKPKPNAVPRPPRRTSLRF